MRLSDTNTDVARFDSQIRMCSVMYDNITRFNYIIIRTLGVQLIRKSYSKIYPNPKLHDFLFEF